MLRKRSKVLKSMADFETHQYRRQAKDVCSDLRVAWERAAEKVGAGVFASQSAQVAAALERISRPVLVICGDRDAVKAKIRESYPAARFYR